MTRCIAASVVAAHRSTRWPLGVPGWWVAQKKEGPPEGGPSSEGYPPLRGGPTLQDEDNAGWERGQGLVDTAEVLP